MAEERGHSPTFRERVPELELISDPEVADGVARAWETALAASDQTIDDTRLLVPEMSAQVGIEHLRGTTLLAAAIADVLSSVHGAQIDRDHLLAGALLHDVGKAIVGSSVASEPAPRHPFYGTHFTLQAGLPGDIAHIVAAHSLEGTYVVKSLECHIVDAADVLSADTVLRRIGRTISDYKRAIYLP